MTRVLAYVPDLMDRSKVAAAAGDRVAFVPTAAGLVARFDAGGRFDLVVVDLGRPGVLDALGALDALEPRPRTIGFGSHVDRELLTAARAAGCDEVMARSAFFSQLSELVA